MALSKTTVNLPDELLSLLLEPPKADRITEIDDEKAWLGLRSYLLGWKIVFDHFSNAVGVLAYLILGILLINVIIVAPCPGELCCKHQGEPIT